MSDQANTTITCKICKFIYEKPILLPCNKTICEAHLQDLAGNMKKSYRCLFCRKLHDIPEHGFEINKPIENIIKSNSHLKEDEKLIKLQLKLKKIKGIQLDLKFNT